jgi:DDE superfamily endonuclease
MGRRERANPGELGILWVVNDHKYRFGTEARSMDQLIPSMAVLIEAFRDCFRIEVFHTFQILIAGWIVCLGPHTISEVWQATGLAAKRHHDTAYAVFHSAAWQWDDLGMVLAALILARLIPGGVVWLVVDDTLCHKRGAKVAFGGIFLDAVLSSKKHKTLRFGLNWVVLGIAVSLPFRKDRYFCLPLLWRLYRKKGKSGHQSRSLAAAELARKLAQANPDRSFWLVGDSAYINAAMLSNRPSNLQMIGPLHWKAALFTLPEPPREGQRGRRRKKGDRLPTPKAMIEDTVAYSAEVQTVRFPKGARELRIQVLRDVLWYRGCKAEPVMVVLVRDPGGQWRDEALVATDPTVSAAFVIQGYCRRWSVELAFFESKQHLGLHDPQVWSERSVERAHPMAWFVAALTILWYSLDGRQGSHVHRDRPWYKSKATPTLTDMLGALRLQMWEREIFEETGDETPSPECVRMLLHKLSAA